MSKVQRASKSQNWYLSAVNDIGEKIELRRCHMGSREGRCSRR